MTSAGRAERAIAARSGRRLALGATLCGLGFGFTAAASATSYVSSFPTVASRHQVLITTSRDSGLAILLGPTNVIDTVGGYTVYKGFVFLTTIGAIWALLAATRLLRGDEDTGRWQIVLAGGTRPGRATVAVLAALAGAIAVVVAMTVALVFAADARRGVDLGAAGIVRYGLSLAIAPLVFGAVGALGSQLAASRQAANRLGMALFGVAFVVRMAGDSGASLHWLRWASPLGWTELMRPFNGPDLVPLVPALLASVALTAAAVVIASRRDVGAGVFDTGGHGPTHTRGLDSALGLTVRLSSGSIVAWCAGALASGFALGIIAKVATGAPPRQFRRTLEKFGVHGSFAHEYLGIAFLLVAAVVALAPAGLLDGAADEMTSGRLLHVVVSPVRRTTWFLGRVLVTGAVVVACAFLGGLGAWIGAAIQGLHVGAGSMLGAGLNVVPSALVALGVGAVVLAVAPRAAAAAVYCAVGWSFLVEVLASTVSGLAGLDRVSLFHFMALAPAQTVRAPAVVITTAVGLALVAVAATWFSRRDLAIG